MQIHSPGGSSAPGSVAPPRVTDAADLSSTIAADRRRLHSAITRTYWRIDAAKRGSNWEAEQGARDDLQRLLNQLARLPIVGRVPSGEA